jgi:hypothetical protein
MMPLRLPRTPLTRSITLLSLSLPLGVAYFSTMTTSKATQSSNAPSTNSALAFPTRPYKPRHDTFPYTARDFLRQDESDDTDFYSTPRFVTHIDDNAITLLKQYYAANLPRKGRVLDLCSSWISHFPPDLESSARARRARKSSGQSEGGEEGLEVVGLGMNKKELDANPILSSSILQNLNINPILPSHLTPLDATTCVVSIDYLIKPVDMLSSLHQNTRVGGKVHLIVSNRCFPTKAIGRWLRISEEERLQMVGNYLRFGGWRDIEIVEVCDGKGSASGLMGMFGGGVDPLWVVRGVKVEGGEGTVEQKFGQGKSEL